ncbi:HTH_XRE and NB-ARC domain-containing protein [Ktedonobacteria bacterium brp13]|nr:HTH_XRE and NB-ARC domain-containing protein [Ktedonobacteria bacterium brp13]
MQTPEMSPQPRILLAQARNDRRLSQQEVADMIGSTYVNISRWERGITRPSPYFRRKLCDFYQKREDELDLLPVRTKEKAARQHGDMATDSSPVALNGKDAGNSTLPSLNSSDSTISSLPQPIYDPAIPLQPAISLIGRDRDIARIKQRVINKNNVALTALNGLPGVGKTALSITMAHDADVRALFKDGVLWAGLGPTPNMPGLLSRWGGLLGISPTQMANLNNNEAWAHAIRNAIGERALLLVIDDAWKLEEALTFRVGGPNCTHLVTTRFPTIATAMTVDGALLIEELGIDDSIHLLDQLAPQVIQREQQRVRELAQAVGGLPLALTLMGNYLRKQAYSGPARRITAALERLNSVEIRMKIEEPHVPAESHPSLPIEQSLSIQSVVAVTDQLLEKKTQAALYALSVLPAKPDTFSEETALAVAACQYEELDNLSDAGMLESTSGDRYQLHQVIADYARLQIAPEQLREAQERLVKHASGFIEEHKKDFERLEQESSIIQAALETAHEIGMEVELTKAVSYYAPFLIMRGFYEQAEQTLQQAHDVAIKQNDTYRKAETLLYLGEVAQKRGNYTQAETNFQAGLQLAREIQDNELICAFLGDLGDIKWRTGDYKQAEANLQEGLDLSKKIEDLERVSKILKTLGNVEINQGNYKQSYLSFQEALTYAKKIGDREQACFLLSNLAVSEGAMGNYTQAASYLQEGLVLAKQIGHREQICMLLLNLGDVATVQTHYEQARFYLEEGLLISRQIGHREALSVILVNLGTVAVAQNNLSEAEEYFKETLSIARQLNRPHLTANVLNEYGKLDLHQRRIDQAEINFKEAISIAPEGCQDLVALANFGLAKVMLQRGEIQKATITAQESLSTLESMTHSSTNEVRDWLNNLNK